MSVRGSLLRRFCTIVLDGQEVLEKVGTYPEVDGRLRWSADEGALRAMISILAFLLGDCEIDLIVWLVSMILT